MLELASQRRLKLRDHAGLSVGRMKVVYGDSCSEAPAEPVRAELVQQRRAGCSGCTAGCGGGDNTPIQPPHDAWGCDTAA
jgi:hypothetical protein